MVDNIVNLCALTIGVTWLHKCYSSDLLLRRQPVVTGVSSVETPLCYTSLPGLQVTEKIATVIDH